MKQSSNNPKTWLFEDVSKNILKTEKFATKFKYYVFAGVILFLLATVVYSFFGFNLSNELKAHSVISVDYKSTLTNEEYTQLEEEMNAIIDDNGKFTVSFERGGHVTNTRLTVKLINDNYKNEELQTILSQIKVDIEDKWSGSILNLEVSEPASHTPYYYQEVVSAILASVFILAGLFIFMWVRHEFLSAISIIIAFIYNIGVLFSLLLLLRIPLTLSFLSFFVVSTTVASLIFIVVSDSVRKIEATKKITNAKAVHTAVGEILPIVLLVVLAIVIISLPIITFFLIMGLSVAFTVISLVISILFGVFIGLVFTPACWATFYNREKDKRLTAKIEKQAQTKDSKTPKRKKKNDDEEKVLV